MKTKLVKKNFVFVVAVLALVLAVIFGSPAKTDARPPAPQQNAGMQKPVMEGKTAGEYYKNIQILKDVPAAELKPTMKYISLVLGFECDTCHVQGHPESDEKKMKKVARDMMQMTLAINKVNFKGDLVVTCYMCHRGVGVAASLPLLTEAILTTTPRENAAPGPNPPKLGPVPPRPTPPPAGVTVDQVLDKYEQALGGKDAIEKNKTLAAKGIMEVSTHGTQSPVDGYKVFPDKVLILDHSSQGEVSIGSDGTTAWKQQGPKIERLYDDDLVTVSQMSAFYTPAEIGSCPKKRLIGSQTINDRNAYIVVCPGPNNTRTFFDFDTETGLLLRVQVPNNNPVGGLPQEADFEDYRVVNGLKVPYTARFVSFARIITYKWNEIKANVPVDPARFTMPASPKP